jgi:hypothetical protein
MIGISSSSSQPTLLGTGEQIAMRNDHTACDGGREPRQEKSRQRATRSTANEDSETNGNSENKKTC